jgi:hypothetical protein
MFQMKMSPSSSGSKNKPSKEPEGIRQKTKLCTVVNRTCSLIHVGFLLGLFFYPEDGGNID